MNSTKLYSHAVRLWPPLLHLNFNNNYLYGVYYILECYIPSQIHFLVGKGSADESYPLELRGAIDDIAGSPNDPLFILHHLMMDCLLQEWMKRHRKSEFPVHPLIRDGHRRDDFIRGFFPLYTNGEVLTRAEEFGYYCSLPNVGLTEPIGTL